MLNQLREAIFYCGFGDGRDEFLRIFKGDAVVAIHIVHNQLAFIRQLRVFAKRFGFLD